MTPAPPSPAAPAVPLVDGFGRQHRDRWTDSDHHLIGTALAHTETGTTETEQQLFSLRS